LNRRQLLRLTTYVVVLAVMVAILARLAHHRYPPPVQANRNSAAAAAPASSDQPETAVDSESAETRILASCEPRLGPNSASVPNIDVSQMPNPENLSLVVRFWVNGDGFVTKGFFVGDSVVTAEDQETEMHYTKGLTFLVPSTPECGVRQIELLGTFTEKRGSSGGWTTVFDVHARYSLIGKRVVRIG
jgi:hypothetical protein